jgi:NAD(P)-dependent dehydrogenase (short-subunit alcohol dehydrogenase family)
MLKEAQMRLQNKTCLVTGGGSGLGRAIAERFAREGARVAVIGRHPQSLEGTVEAITAIGGEAMLVVADISAPEAAVGAVEKIMTQWGRIDILVNNAGVVDRQTCTEASVEDWDRVMNINLRAVFVMCKAVIPQMIENGSGAIVNIASISAVRGQSGACSYSASKAGMINFARTIANDYGRFGIRANNILPGLVETDLSRSRLQEGEIWDEVMAENFIPHYPLGRVGQPSDISNAALFLASDEAAWITGVDLAVDGGYLAKL